MSKQSLLLVDHDTRSMRVLEVSLRKAGFTVTTAVSVGDALEKLEVHPPDLIISETTFPSDQADGFELRRRVRGTPEWSEIPFIFLTAEQTIENKIKGLELGVDDYLTKPIYIKEIVTRINILLQKRQRTRFEERRDGRTRFAGRVADMPVVDVIQTIEISRKSGVIQFVGDRGRQAAIYFRDGRVIDAEAGALQGEDAVYRLLTWSEGEFEVVFRTVRRREVISTSSQGLLMEGMRRLDEWSRLLEQLPPLTHRFEVDAAELALRLGDIPDDNNGILRLVDGKRTLLEVIDASDVGDLECLQAISRLYFEDMLIDLDHGKSMRRTSGSMLIASADAPSPTPIEDAASGPIEDLAARAGAEGSGPIELPAATPVETTAPVETAAIESEITAPNASSPELADRPSGTIPVGDVDIAEEVQDDTPTPFMGSYRQSSLRLIDEAVAAAQAIEPSLFEDEKPASATDDSKASPLSISPATALPGLVRLSIQKPAAPGPEDEEDPESNGSPKSILDEMEFDYPSTIDADDPTPMPIVRRKPRPITAREDSGLRMIGSLGRDRAETSGELTSAGATTPIPVTETQRELVTIHPRRITREVPIVGGDAAAKKPESDAKDATTDATAATTEPAADSAEAITPRSTPIAKAALPPAAPAVEPPAAPAKPEPARPPVASETLRIKPLDRKLDEDDDDDVRPPTNSSAKFVVVAIAVLAAIAVYLVVKKNRTRTQVPVVVTSDAATQVTPITPDAIVEADDAAVALAPDAGVVVDAAVALADAAPAVADAAVAATVDAGAGSAAPPDREAQAKALYQQAYEAIEEGDADKALQLADASLKLRNAARAHLVRATALQRLDRIDEAIEATNNAEKLSPKYAGIYDQRGRILWSARRFDEARVAFERYLELQPTGKRAEEVKRMLERSP